MTNERIRELMVEVMTNTKKGHEEAHKAIKALGYEIKLDDGIRRFIIKNPRTGRSVAVYDGWRPSFDLYGSRVSEKYARKVKAEEYSMSLHRLNTHFDIVNYLDTDRKADKPTENIYKTAMMHIKTANDGIKDVENAIEEERRDFEQRMKHHEERMLELAKRLEQEKFESKAWKKEIMDYVRK